MAETATVCCELDVRDVVEAGAHQPLRQRLGGVVRGREPLAVAEGAAAAGGGEPLAAVATLTTTPATTVAVDRGGDGHGVLRDAVEEVHGAVDRVDDPGRPRSSEAAAAPSSPTNPSSGSRGHQPVEDQPLGGLVDLGDDVDRAGLGARRPRRRRGCARLTRSAASSATSAARSSSSSYAGGRRHAQSCPHSAGRGPRGLGQQPAGHRSQDGSCEPTVARSGSSPRSAAARSTSRSRTIATNRGSTPAVAARREADARLLGGRARLGVEVVDDLHVVGDEPDGDHDHAADARGRRAPRCGR